VCLLNVTEKVSLLLDETENDEKTGVKIILRAIEEPIRQIAINGGVDGSVIIDTIRRKKKDGLGYDVIKGDYVDMIKRGIIDPTKVARSALQNAASIAALVLTTESLVTDIPTPEPAAPAQGGGMGGMY
jgi:chaperonin GroEL